MTVPNNEIVLTICSRLGDLQERKRERERSGNWILYNPGNVRVRETAEWNKTRQVYARKNPQSQAIEEIPNFGSIRENVLNRYIKACTRRAVWCTVSYWLASNSAFKRKTRDRASASRRQVSLRIPLLTLMYIHYTDRNEQHWGPSTY